MQRALVVIYCVFTKYWSKENKKKCYHISGSEVMKWQWKQLFLYLITNTCTSMSCMTGYSLLSKMYA